MSKPNLKKQSRTDWARVDALREQEIDYTEIPELGDEFFKSAVLRMPEPKALVTLRLDRDVLEWFKKQGPRYQTRINALLRAYVEAKKRQAG
ncbi:MAG TPA: BrnA antitoxin family protein [Nitrospiria bacterium]|nr:BrnA antitoxin family protein [Nitrospiria bacterium]